MTIIRIKRQYAEWREDAIQVALPEGIDPNEKEAVKEWAEDNYERLYGDARIGIPSATLDWEDECIGDAGLDDAYIVEVFDGDTITQPPSSTSKVTRASWASTDGSLSPERIRLSGRHLP